MKELLWFIVGGFVMCVRLWIVIRCFGWPWCCFCVVNRFMGFVLVFRGEMIVCFCCVVVCGGWVMGEGMV